MPKNDRTVGTDDFNIGAELKQDKIRLLRENRKLRLKLDAAVNDKLALSVTNAHLEEKVDRLEENVTRLEKHVQSLQDMKEYRERGILALTVLCGLSPLFLSHWIAKIVFYGLLACILCFVIGTMCRNQKNND